MRIAILGSAGSSIGKAPFRDERYIAWVEGKLPDIAVAHDQVPGDWDIWGCSPGCWAVIPRATRWFEVHRWENNVPWFSGEYRDFMRRFKGPVYTGGRVPEIPNHVVYPIDHIEEKFSAYFLNSSLSLMIALAIDTLEQIRKARAHTKEFKDENARQFAALMLPKYADEAELDKDDSDDVIGLWGVDMAAADEYAYQRPGCQFFLLEAMRRGFGVYLPPESDLMRPKPVYGISEWDHNYIKLTARAKELNNVTQAATAEMEQAKIRIAGSQGEQLALQAFVSTWTSPYGMQHGIINRQTPGTGLGGGITHLDARPVSRMPAVIEAQAAAEAPQTQVVATEDKEAMLDQAADRQSLAQAMQDAGTKVRKAHPRVQAKKATQKR